MSSPAALVFEMDLRRPIARSLAAAGALLIVTGLSLGGGVALADPGPAAAGPPDAVKATSTSADSSDPSSDKPRKKDRKSKKSTNTTDPGSAGSGSSDSGSGTSGSSDSDSTGSTAPTRSTGSTATTATTTAPTTATTATTTTTRPTTTSAPTTTATTSAGSGGANTSAPDGSGDTYDGKPITATEDDDSTTTTFDDGRDRDSPGPARRPAARDGSGSGSDLPPGIYPADPGSGSGSPGARTANSPAPSSKAAPAQPVMPNPPIVVTDTAPGAQTTGSTSANAAAGGATDPTDSEVRGANQVQEEAPAPVARKARQLGQTGDGTRRLILFGGVALLLGAVVVGFTGRDGPILAAAAALPAGPVRRRAKPRRELDGWEDGVPLAPAKRELARQRLGLSADVWYYDDEPGA